MISPVTAVLTAIKCINKQWLPRAAFGRGGNHFYIHQPAQKNRMHGLHFYPCHTVYLGFF